jgi:hypothetical protein
MSYRMYGKIGGGDFYLRPVVMELIAALKIVVVMLRPHV